VVQIDVDLVNPSDVTVVVRGELDIVGAAQLRETITVNRPGDLGDSDYCAPAGATEALR
jgi:hypothetical protein